jgi:hypothetical protein
MGRATLALTVWVVEVAAAAAVLAYTFGTGPSVDEGRRLYEYRVLLEEQVESARSADVVWLGDSTIMSLVGHLEYPELFATQVLARRRLRSADVAVPGLDFFGYYALVGPIVESKPRVVVLIANLRLLDPHGMSPRADLVSFVPVAELPRLLTLPFASRGVTVPGILLARLLRMGPVADALFLFEGARRRIADAEWWNILGPMSPTSQAWSYYAVRQRDMLRRVMEYRRAVGPRHPMMRFARATVDTAVRHGVRPVVIVTPVPFTALRRLAVLDRDRIARTVETLRSVVTAAGGTFVDLHAALRDADFADAEGHFTEDGAQHMADMVRLPIAMALGDPALAAEGATSRVTGRVADQPAAGFDAR